MFSRILKYSVKNILRNKFLSVSSVLVLGLLIFFINILVVLHNVSINLIDEVNDKLTISLYLKDDLSEESLAANELIKDLERVSPDIVVRYNSKEDVLADLEQKSPQLVQILERDNPLPPTITIEWVSLEKYDQLNDVISSRASLMLDSQNLDPEVLARTEWALDLSTVSGATDLVTPLPTAEDEVFSYEKQFNRINDVTSVLSLLKYGLYFIIAIFVASIGIIVYSVISNFVYYYRNEIYITKLVGGSNIFIYGPFSLQGLIYTVFAYVISIGLFLLLASNASRIFITDIGDIESFIFSTNFTSILLIELIVFAILGIFSGFLSSKKYLNNNYKNVF